jgi:hypothetical protein
VRRKGKRVEYEIIKRLGVLSARHDPKLGVLTREVGIVSWLGNPPKLDIREYSEGRPVFVRKQVTFTRKETELLRDILNDLDPEEIPE